MAPLSRVVSLAGFSLAPRDALRRASAVFALTKPRLAAMSVLSAMAAYATAQPADGTAVATIVGTTLSAAGALSLNQWWERRADSVMKRTRGRPLPMQSIAAGEALGWSLGFAVSGVALLEWRVNLAAASCAAATIVLYALIYTPLKRRTRWATEIGALSGALPALLGNAAAGDLWSRPGLTLTAVLLLWQMPHFFAIGWRHREDYRAGGFLLLPAVDPSGARTAAWTLGYSLALAVVSLVPCAVGWHGASYAVPVTLVNAWFLRAAWKFRVDGDRDRAARRLFAASLVYLPIVMAALMAERLISSPGVAEFLFR